MANHVEENKLLHWRIGHVSDNILNKLVSFKNLNNDNCDICCFSKQIRLLFLLSTSKVFK
jgi:hypothetical protein